MGSQQSRPQTPEIQFRVLIIGRANAGKTAILQRVCETTESPIIYRGKGSKEEVCRPTVLSVCVSGLISHQVKLDPSMEVSDRGTSLWLLLTLELSEASTALTTNSCFPITRVTFFTTPAESSQVA